VDFAALAWSAASAAFAADIELGKAKAAEVRETCHGAGGNSTSQISPSWAASIPTTREGDARLQIR
jgi:cytochrome c553